MKIESALSFHCALFLFVHSISRVNIDVLYSHAHTRTAHTNAHAVMLTRIAFTFLLPCGTRYLRLFNASRNYLTSVGATYCPNQELGDAKGVWASNYAIRCPL